MLGTWAESCQKLADVFTREDPSRKWKRKWSLSTYIIFYNIVVCIYIYVYTFFFAAMGIDIL
jgi:hypothetical protein